MLSYDEGALVAFVVTFLVAIFVGVLVSLRSQLPVFKLAINELFVALWNPLVDYSFKLIVVAKNLFWTPLGLDHRVFKEKFKRVSSSAGRAEIVSVDNRYPLAPKSSYFLLCATVWSISAYVWYAVSHSIESIYGNVGDEFLLMLPFLMAGVVALLDIWILKSNALSSNGSSRAQAILVFMLRFVVSLCIASIAAFHFLSVEYSSDIKEASQRHRYHAIEMSPEYGRLVSMRNAVVRAHYDSDARLECLKLLSAGSSGVSGGVIYPKEKFKDIASLYRLPSEEFGPKVGGGGGSVQAMDVHCEYYMNGKEPKCQLAKADQRSCPRLTYEAKRGFVSDVQLFGTDIAIRRGWYDVHLIYPSLTAIVVSESQSDVGKMKSLRDSLFSSGEIGGSNGDLGIAARAIAGRVKDESWWALFLLLSPVVVLAVYEFIILILKTIWGLSAVDERFVIIDKQVRDAIGGKSVGDNLKEELSFSSDFSMQDHLGAISSSLRVLVEPIIESKFVCGVAVSVLMFISLNFALFELQATMVKVFGSVVDVLVDLFRNKVCPRLGYRC